MNDIRWTYPRPDSGRFGAAALTVPTPHTKYAPSLETMHSSSATVTNECKCRDGLSPESERPGYRNPPLRILFGFRSTLRTSCPAPGGRVSSVRLPESKYLPQINSMTPLTDRLARCDGTRLTFGERLEALSPLAE